MNKSERENNDCYRFDYLRDFRCRYPSLQFFKIACTNHRLDIDPEDKPILDYPWHLKLPEITESKMVSTISKRHGRSSAKRSRANRAASLFIDRLKNDFQRVECFLPRSRVRENWYPEFLTKYFRIDQYEDGGECFGGTRKESVSKNFIPEIPHVFSIGLRSNGTSTTKSKHSCVAGVITNYFNIVRRPQKYSPLFHDALPEETKKERTIVFSLPSLVTSTYTRKNCEIKRIEQLCKYQRTPPEELCDQNSTTHLPEIKVTGKRHTNRCKNRGSGRQKSHSCNNNIDASRKYNDSGMKNVNCNSSLKKKDCQRTICSPVKDDRSEKKRDKRIQTSSKSRSKKLRNVDRTVIVENTDPSGEVGEFISIANDALSKEIKTIFTSVDKKNWTAERKTKSDSTERKRECGSVCAREIKENSYPRVSGDIKENCSYPRDDLKMSNVRKALFENGVRNGRPESTVDVNSTRYFKRSMIDGTGKNVSKSGSSIFVEGEKMNGEGAYQNTEENTANSTRTLPKLYRDVSRSTHRTPRDKYQSDDEDRFERIIYSENRTIIKSSSLEFSKIPNFSERTETCGYFSENKASETMILENVKRRIEKDLDDCLPGNDLSEDFSDLSLESKNFYSIERSPEVENNYLEDTPRGNVEESRSAPVVSTTTKRRDFRFVSPKCDSFSEDSFNTAVESYSNNASLSSNFTLEKSLRRDALSKDDSFDSGILRDSSNFSVESRVNQNPKRSYRKSRDSVSWASKSSERIAESLDSGILIDRSRSRFTSGDSLNDNDDRAKSNVGGKFESRDFEFSPAFDSATESNCSDDSLDRRVDKVVRKFTEKLVVCERRLRVKLRGMENRERWKSERKRRKNRQKKTRTLDSRDVENYNCESPRLSSDDERILSVSTPSLLSLSDSEIDSL